MTDDASAQRDPRKVRLGLAIICVVVVVAVAGVFFVEAALGKAVMFAVAATAFVRAYGLVRWIRAADAGEDR
jgi:hypothetical protein